MKRPSYASVRDFFGRRRTDFGIVFGSPAGQRVFSELCRHARMRESIMFGNERLTTHYTGRQDMIHFIENHLSLNADELIDVYNPADKALRIGDGQ